MVRNNRGSNYSGERWRTYSQFEKLTIRYAHRDSPCPSGYENAIFVQFDGHHGRGGYGAWIKEPEQFYDSAAESAGPNNSSSGIQNAGCEK